MPRYRMRTRSTPQYSTNQIRGALTVRRRHNAAIAFCGSIGAAFVGWLASLTD